MTTFAERLKQTRLKKCISQTELAELTGITSRSIQNYESGSRMPNSLEITEKIARVLDVSAAYLLGEEEESTPVMLLGEIACGPFNFGEENILETYRFPKAFTGEGEFFLLRTFGESMIDAGIEPGDLVMIRQQNTARPGDIVVVSVGDETTLKRYYPEPEKQRIRLHPENESMEDMYVTECVIQGVAVKVIKDL
ncbi:MAG: helix-turn-helix domain-containing protein [Clostridia bacterium]|nr:helix-turn-helix domain-containing protein [Clostridia bacterium]